MAKHKTIRVKKMPGRNVTIFLSLTPWVLRWQKIVTAPARWKMRRISQRMFNASASQKQLRSAREYGYRLGFAEGQEEATRG